MIDRSMLQSLRLNIINIDHVIVSAEWNYTDVYGPYHRLYLVSGGEGVVHHHGQNFHLVKGMLHLVPGYTRSSYRCDTSLEQSYIHFACELEGHFDFFSEMPFQYQVPAKALDHGLFERLLELNPDMGLKEVDPKKYDKKLHLYRAQNYINEVTSPRFLESKGIMLQLISRFLEDGSQTVTDHKDYYRVEKAIRFIRENIDKPMTVKELADVASFTPDHFSRIFAKVMGAGPIEYIHRRRVQRVKLLLLTTEMSLEQIAEKVGFSSATYLLRIFRKYMHMTPKQYRKAAFYG